jgi:tetratricopeptide (TPR) repeat protein
MKPENTIGAAPRDREGPGPLAALLSGKSAPGDAEALYRAGEQALGLKQYVLAVRFFEACIKQDDAHTRANYGLTTALFYLGEFEHADRACRRALEINPHHFPSRVVRGHLAALFGDPATAEACYRDVLSSAARRDDLSSGLVHLRLARGDHSAWRCFAPGAATEQLGQVGAWKPPVDRVWNGDTDPETTVCIYKDGGNGDVFLFSRFVREVAKRVGKVFLAVPENHTRLLQDLPGLAGVVRHPDELPDAQYVHLWALPGIFEYSGDPPSPRSYLALPRTGPSLAHLRGFRVGLTWAGHPNTRINFDRSVPSNELLRPLFRVPGVDWVSLQIGYRSAEAAELPFAEIPDVRDFADTAHVLGQLDLVITVDTAVANLAGALGIRGWVMVPTFPEFRWGMQGDRTPWYPSLRLFRRAHTREWEGVLERIASALAEEAARSRAAPDPG